MLMLLFVESRPKVWIAILASNAPKNGDGWYKLRPQRKFLPGARGGTDRLRAAPALHFLFLLAGIRVSLNKTAPLVKGGRANAKHWRGDSVKKGDSVKRGDSGLQPPSLRFVTIS